MKIENHNNPERSKLCQLIQHMTVTMMTTIDDNGAILSRPMTPLLLDNNDALWFFTDLRSEKTKQLESMNLNFVDSGRATYVSLSGHGEVVTQRSFIDRLWTPFAKPWFPAGPESEHLALLKFIPNVADYWDSSHCKMLRILAMGVAVVTGKTMAIGEHASITELGVGARKSA